MSGSMWDGVDKYHAQRRSEFEKLAAEPCLTEAQVGSRVLVSAGPAGRGFDWERLEAEVLQVADTAYRLRFIGRNIGGEPDIAWIHKFIVTDVLTPPQGASDE